MNKSSGPIYTAMERQLSAWPHMETDEYAAHKVILLSCAEAFDLMVPNIHRGIVPPMQAVTAAKALFGLLKQCAPTNSESRDFFDVELPLFDEA